MKKHTHNQPDLDPNRLAVLHQTEGQWHVLIADCRQESKAPSVLATRAFTDGSRESLDQWLHEQQVGEVICVLPASSVICRTCTLPDASPQQLEQALRLQAEAHLFGIAPSHRLGMAVLDAAPGETSRCGLVLAWPESSAVPAPPTSRPVTYTPDVAALAALLNGHRPTGPLLWLDRADGTLALSLTHANGAVFRCLRETAEDSAEWQESIGRTVAETALSAGHTASFVEETVDEVRRNIANVENQQCDLLVPAELLESARGRLGNCPADAGWWSTYGIAAGIVLARVGSLTPLTRLEASPPEVKPSLIQRTVEALSSPRTAAMVVVVCLILILFGPLTINAARYGILVVRHGDLDERLAAVYEIDDRLAVYEQLRDAAWPMTKVLADLANNTPEGIELDSIRVSSNRNIQVSGTALPHDGRSATELVALMQRQMRDSGIFEAVNPDWGDGDAHGKYSFSLSATIDRPYFRYNYPREQDFAKWTMVERRYGTIGQLTGGSGVDTPGGMRSGLAGGSRTATPPAERPSPPDPDEEAGDEPERLARGEQTGTRESERPSTSRPPRGGESTARSGSTDAISRDQAREEGGTPAHMEIPEPLTESQIDAMTDAEARQALARVSQARQSSAVRDDEELRERLQKEFQLLLARLRRN